MTTEENESERLRMLQAQEARAIKEHDALMAARTAEKDERSARGLLYTRQVEALELQAKNNAVIAKGTAGTGRLAMILDATIKRMDDRTSPTGAANIPKAVAEVLATIAEIERQTAPAPSDPPTPGLS